MCNTDDSEIRMDLPPILLIPDLINLLHMTNTTLHMLQTDPTFPIVEVGNQSIILRESLLDWLWAHERSRLIQPTPDSMGLRPVKTVSGISLPGQRTRNYPN